MKKHIEITGEKGGIYENKEKNLNHIVLIGNPEKDRNELIQKYVEF